MFLSLLSLLRVSLCLTPFLDTVVDADVSESLTANKRARLLCESAPPNVSDDSNREVCGKVKGFIPSMHPKGCSMQGFPDMHFSGKHFFGVKTAYSKPAAVNNERSQHFRNAGTTKRCYFCLVNPLEPSSSSHHDLWGHFLTSVHHKREECIASTSTFCADGAVSFIELRTRSY